MKIQTIFYPGVDKKDLEFGTMREASWQRLHSLLEQALNIQAGEKLIGITITEYGIKGKIEFDDKSLAIREIR